MPSISAESAYLFRHAVLRDAAYQLMPPGDRADMHRLVVEIVEAVYADAIPDEYAPELALHCRFAREHREDEALLEKERHFGRVALERAFSDYEMVQALAWARRLAEICSEDDRADVLLKFARTLAMLGRRDESADVVERILDLTEAGGKPDVRAWASMVKVHLLRVEGRGDEAERIADDVVSRIDELKPGTRAAVLGGYVLLLRGVGRMEEATKFEQRAIEECGEDDGKTKVRLLINAMGPQRSAGHLDQADATGTQALKLARELGDHGAEAAALANLANLRRYQGRHDDAHELRQQALVLARRVGDYRGESLHLAGMGEHLAERGEIEQAQKLCERAIEIAQEAGAPRVEGFALTTLGAMLNEDDRHAEALPLLDRAVELERHARDRLREGTALCVRAFSQVAAGNRKAAREDWLAGIQALENAGGKMEAESMHERMRRTCDQHGLAPLDESEGSPDS